MTTPSSIQQLKGLGPKSQEMLAQIGVGSVEVFLNTDPFELFRRLKQHSPETSLNMLYAIIGAQEGVDWRLIARQRKTEILLRLDEMGLAPP